MKKTLVSITLLLAFPVMGQSIRFEQNLLFVKLKSPSRTLKHHLIQDSKKIFGRLYEVKTSDAILLENDLIKNIDVEWVEKSFISRSSKFEELHIGPEKEDKAKDQFGFNDPKVSKLWGFHSFTRNGISAEEAYNEMPSWEAQPVVVAVIDTGVDYRHEDLRNTMWSNPKEIPNNGIDDDNNGHVDDIHGIDLIGNDADPMAGHFHGTHVAGTIAAEQNNHKGIAGVSSHAQIMAIRAIPDSSDETDSDVIQALLYAAKNGARIINCSFGKTRQGQAVAETIDHIGAKYGALVVAASGNDSNGPSDWHNIDRNGHYPSSFNTETMLVVTATDSRGALAHFSNIGKVSVDVAAPGDDIYSTIPRNRYGSSSGTSMATPMVSGIAAQLLAYYPGLTPVELKMIIMNTVVTSEKLKNKTQTNGRVDLARAMRYASQYFSHRH